MRLVTSIFFLTISFISCSRDLKLEGAEYMKYVEDKSNGLKKEVEVNDLKYTFLYRPAEYVAYKEMTNGTDDTSFFRKRVKELKKTVWFNIYIKTEGNENPLKHNVSGLDEYNRRINYFLTEAGKNISLNYGDKGDMKSVAYHFENNYGLTPMDVIVVGFEIPDDKPIEDIILEYDDKLFNGGPIKIKIDKTNLIDIPKLIL